MRVAIPVDENHPGTAVCASLARAPYYLIKDTETEETTFVENTAANSQGGAGVKAAQLLVDQKVDALLTPRCGQNAAEVLTAAKMEIYKTEYPSAKENLQAFKSSLLAALTEFHAGFHGHGEGHGNGGQ
ncbi:NifB/NifX family molybdenum-iron cluster-binding protein [Acidaminobacter hydrogenoformans]|uniref:Predicted Fe-Mo cluster-binding protein, NifX family n=1 Tax=Acidaminobacter hydrogenoformans DSM 2784 TaxID=1120920 RepID=A0A1G5S1U3_9FIRM|nr:NifB/NifX family molybdenum-iron cluster-binding protein [Acidaminobacter hydrogenoformans]SCZ80128.1 Predicted Fe-Mo cluster-binding protein, NifX family [Acidaminobacter hydrogenoformans DSM 2784]